MVGIIIAVGSCSKEDLLVNQADKKPKKPKIAFVSKRDGNYEIYVMDAAGKNQKNLTENKADDMFPAWSPDGTKIAFHSYRHGNWEIYVMDADGKNQKRLTENPGEDRVPAWSPLSFPEISALFAPLEVGR